MQTYNIPNKGVEGRKFSIGLKLEKTGALEPGKKRFIPGPGDYKPSFSQSEKSLPKYSLKGRLDTKKHD